MRTTLPTQTAENLLQSLEQLADPVFRDSLKRFGVQPTRSFGIKIPEIRRLARCQKSHTLALDLWQSGYHEARILASMVDEVDQVTREQMESWAADFDAWDICDLVIINLFHRTEFAFECSREWVFRQPEYICRAGFALMAVTAIHRKDVADEQFLPFFPLIIDHVYDDRGYVNKAANWALRQMGKRSIMLRQEAIAAARLLMGNPSPSARWVGADALRELQNRSLRDAIPSGWI